ncbi:oligosaccharide flippase family protein [Buttiauxella sp. A111]|uniref:oligosaccharide flippase family protein n=1 Tax=Buttiauxella sp. A111 TaxID=2563088 RepID=UPI001621F646|nr:oligosaccharide flippase family protein [Buttiauxella sp. A111]
MNWQLKMVQVLSNKKSLIKNIFLLFALQFFNYVAPFLILPYLARSFSVVTFGSYIYYITIAQFLAIFIGLGFDLSAPRRICKVNSEFLNNYVSVVYCLKLIALIFSNVVIVIFLLIVGKYESVMMFSLFITGLGLTLTPQWFFSSVQRMGVVSLAGIATKAMFLCFVYAFIKNDEDLHILYFLYSVSFLLPGIFCSVYLKTSYNIKLKIRKNMLVLIFKDTIDFFISRLVVSLYTTSCGLIIGTLKGAYSLSIYSVSEKLYLAAQSLIYPVTNSLYPYISQQQNKRFAILVFYCGVIISCIGVIAGCFISRDVLLFVFGEKYLQSNDVLKVFIFTLGVTFPSVILGYPILSSFKLSKYTNKSVYYGAVIFFISITYFIITNTLSPVTMASCVLLSETIVFLYRLGVFYTKFIRV